MTKNTGLPPRRELTPLQRALLTLGVAFDHARYDRRTFDVFVDCLTIRAARENALRLDRPA